MQSLQQKASELSGVDRSDAFAIDDTNIFQKLGLETFIKLSTNFCTSTICSVFKLIRAFSGAQSTLQSLDNEVLINGTLDFALSSSPFPVTHQTAKRWLHHMQQALDGMTDIDADSKIKMMNFFRHTAFFLVAGDKLKNSNQGVPFKDGTDRPAAMQGDFTLAKGYTAI
ncbi:hypothetical protein CsSME_00049192 [Camellia sinensis var. sinensis]